MTKLEHKLGIRASDTASIVLQDCRVPFDAMFGSPEVVTSTTKGFKGAKATFDANPSIGSVYRCGGCQGKPSSYLKEILAEQVLTSGMDYPAEVNQYRAPKSSIWRLCCGPPGY